MENSKFIHESEVYRLLQRFDLKVPLFASITSTVNPQEEVSKFPFKAGEPVVIKGIGDDLWHKSDIGVLAFQEYSADSLLNFNSEIQKKLEGKHPWIETLVCQKVPFQTRSNLPTEGFVSLSMDNASGPLITMGIGGIHTEYWAQVLKSEILIFSPEVMTADQAFEQLKSHVIGQVWLGTLRQGKALTTEAKLKSYISNLFKLSLHLKKNNITLLEMNPVVVDTVGDFMALDGVGLLGEEANTISAPSLPTQSLLSPQTIAIAGVSSKAGSFGTLIFNNILDSQIDKKNIIVIKPGSEEFQGIPCVENIAALKEKPVDVLILALPAPITVETVEELLNQGGGAQVVYLVAGGIGDGADKEGLAKKLKDTLAQKRKEGKWTPVLVGPNNLGIVSSAQKLSTLFIPKARLPITFHPQGNIGFISQSGAFFITRFSNGPELPVKYGFCIGNQLDLKAADFLEAFSSDKDLKVAAVYTEGFDENEALRFALKSKELKAQGKQVVLYKGGRSRAGQAAAAGHTGAMAGNYKMQKKLFEAAGIIVTESYDEFANMLNFLSTREQQTQIKKVGVITNAGSESVVAADVLGDEEMIFPLSKQCEMAINDYLKEVKLSGLVSAANPLDLTPMASDEIFLKSARIMLEKEDIDAVVLGMVPLTERLSVFTQEDRQKLILEIRKLKTEFKKDILVVVDSGKMYEEHRSMLKEAGIPVFTSIEAPLRSILRLKV